MYPLSRWMIEAQPLQRFDIDHPEQLDRLERYPIWMRRRRVERQGRLALLATGLRRRVGDLVSRASLGPVPERCAGDPAGPRW